MISVTRISCIIFICSLWSGEARTFKSQEALIEESVGADYFCGGWSQLRVTCIGNASFSTNGKSDSECKEWCETQGTGCCETKTTGECLLVTGNGDSEWSPDDTESKTTYCIDDGYLDLVPMRFSGCGLDGTDQLGQYIVPGQGHSLIDCQQQCSARADCNFINWGGGACYLFTTCDGSNGGFWKVMERVDLCEGTVCASSDLCHDSGTCDPVSGICTTPAVTDGSVCDDNDPATTSDQCTLGECIGSDAGATGDPHFVGFDGSRYDFQGSPGSVFNLITDKEFQLNARFVESPSDGKTYMGAVAAKVGPNEVVVSPDVVVVNDRSVTKGGYVYLYDGDESLGLLIVEETHVHVKSLSFQVDIIISREGEFTYLDVNAAANSDHLVHPHGILGQTAQYLLDGSKPHPVRLSHKNLYASGFLAGSPDDYLVADGLLGTDFAFNRFGADSNVAKSQVSRRFGFGRALYQKKF